MSRADTMLPESTNSRAAEPRWIVENRDGRFVASFCSQLLGDFFIAEGSGCYRARAGSYPVTGFDGWQPIATAPRDGSWFFTKSGTATWSAYDIACFDTDLDEFVKAGCGFQFVTHWRAAEPTVA